LQSEEKEQRNIIGGSFGRGEMRRDKEENMDNKGSGRGQRISLSFGTHIFTTKST